MSSILSMVPQRLFLVGCSCVLLIMSSFPLTWATLQEGAILWRWKNMMAGNGSEKLTNWGNDSDPCAANPWFHVLCNYAGDLGSSDLSGPLSPELGQVSGLDTLTLYNNSFKRSKPLQLGNLPQLVILDLSHNMLSGPIPRSLGNLLSVNFTEAANNYLPRFCSNRSSAKEPISVFAGNSPSLCGAPVGKACPEDPKLPSEDRQGLTSKIIIVIVVSMVFGVLSISIFFATIVRRLRKKIMALRAIKEEFARKEVKPNLYSYNELKSATQNFSSHNVLGKGGFGTVYKGVLSNGTEVAVKHLSKSKQVLHEFLNEIVLITGIRHCNLVKLKGCCLREDQRILVYEYIDNGDLSDALWNPDTGKSSAHPAHRRGLDWAARLSIILEVAQGLTYLHEHVQPPIIHRDIKAPNILLDRELRVKIADFGLALLFPPLEDGRTHLSAVEIAGTRGYMAPEYASFGQVTTKIDVFSFGVLVLEIVSGRKNVDVKKPPGQQYLLEWVWELHAHERLHDVVDEQLTPDKRSMEEITRVTIVGLLCIQYMASRRPCMSDVVAMLQGRIPLPDISTNYELDVYRGHEAAGTSSGMTSTLERNWSESDDVIVECEEFSLMDSHDDHQALGSWETNRSVATTRRSTVKRCELYRDSSTQTEPFAGYLT